MKPPVTPNGTVRRHRSSSTTHQRRGGSPRPQVPNASERRLNQQTTLSGRLRKSGRPSRSTYRLQRPNSTDLIMHRSRRTDPRRVRMEARWQIEPHVPTRARHGGRAEKNERGVDTAGLLMEAASAVITEAPVLIRPWVARVWPRAEDSRSQMVIFVGLLSVLAILVRQFLLEYPVVLAHGPVSVLGADAAVSCVALWFGLLFPRLVLSGLRPGALEPGPSAV